MSRLSSGPAQLHDSVSWLGRILEPLSPQAFLEAYWGQTFVYVPGTTGKFATLFSWDQLSEILALHRFGSPRLRLCKDGRLVSPTRYQYPAVLTGNGSILHAAALQKELRDGATLIIEEIDDACPSLREAMLSLERVLRVHVYANLYASWGTANAFPVHWDPHDTFIVQVSGRKRWRVWAPTRQHPLEADIQEAAPPVGEPVWAAEMQEGCCLYLPRGWWHVAYPLNEPSLHLTITVRNMTGIDLLIWLSKQLRGTAVFRKDLPHLASRGEQEAHLAELKREMMSTWSDNLVAAFLGSLEAGRDTRPALHLPDLMAD